MGTAREEKQKAMMRNVVQIAKDFKIRTVAEGVETEENEHFLCRRSIAITDRAITTAVRFRRQNLKSGF